VVLFVLVNALAYTQHVEAQIQPEELPAANIGNDLIIEPIKEGTVLKFGKFFWSDEFNTYVFPGCYYVLP
jgi:hypothetical protein